MDLQAFKTQFRKFMKTISLMTTFFLKHNLFSQDQFGFRKNLSCCDVIIDTTEYMREN